jgi:hypothetical protein
MTFTADDSDSELNKSQNGVRIVSCFVRFFVRSITLTFFLRLSVSVNITV